MKCELCYETFPENMNGLVELTFHRLVMHTDKEINGFETKNQYGKDFVEYD